MFCAWKEALLSGTLGYAVLQPDRRRAAAQRTPEAAATPPLAEAAAPPRPTYGRPQGTRPAAVLWRPLAGGGGAYAAVRGRRCFARAVAKRVPCSGWRFRPFCLNVRCRGGPYCPSLSQLPGVRAPSFRPLRRSHPGSSHSPPTGECREGAIFHRTFALCEQLAGGHVVGPSAAGQQGGFHAQSGEISGSGCVL